MIKTSSKFIYERHTNCLRMMIISFVVYVSISGSLVNSREYIDREQQIKAMYLMNIVNFISWPNQYDMEGYVNICVYEEHPITAHVMQLENKIVNSMSLRVFGNISLDEMEKCNIVFVGEKETKIFSTQGAVYKAKDALIVGEGYEYIENGGMLSFCIRDNKVKVVVNQEMVKKSDIKISSKLLRISEMVN